MGGQVPFIGGSGANLSGVVASPAIVEEQHPRCRRRHLVRMHTQQSASERPQLRHLPALHHVPVWRSVLRRSRDGFTGKYTGPHHAEGAKVALKAKLETSSKHVNVKRWTRHFQVSTRILSNGLHLHRPTTRSMYALQEGQ